MEEIMVAEPMEVDENFFSFAPSAGVGGANHEVHNRGKLAK